MSHCDQQQAPAYPPPVTAYPPPGYVYPPSSQPYPLPQPVEPAGPQMAAPPPVETKSRGDDFWKGCAAALCCCCVLDCCF